MTYEEITVAGKQLLETIRKLLGAGNVRRIIIKDAKGNRFLEMPLIVGAVGTIAAPLLAGFGAMAALLSHYTVVIERSPDDSGLNSSAKGSGPSELPKRTRR